MDQKYSAGNLLTRTAAALARAAQTLEGYAVWTNTAPIATNPFPENGGWMNALNVVILIYPGGASECSRI